MGNLTALTVKNAKGPRVYSDGAGLLLRVKASGAKSWVLRVQHAGRRQDVGLGALSDLTLAEAREKAAALRKLARQGKDPLAARDFVEPTVPTFAEAVDKAHAELGKGWADKTAIAFKASLEQHALPTLGSKRVDEIGSEHVIAALAPIWTEKPQQARKVRHRIQQVLAFAKAKGWRSERPPDPAEVRRGLARQPRSQGFAAVPYAEVPSLVAGELDKVESSARLGLLFAILTAARSGEVRQATWAQIDREARTWSRPAEVMKSSVPHVVTLNSAALAVLDRAARFGSEGLLFPAARQGPLSDMSLAKMLRNAGRSETVHGFRSSFRDWAAEKMPQVPAMVAEMALAHSVGTATEKAYLRSDLRALRFKLMDAWGKFAAPNLNASQQRSRRGE
ncbi:site-specific integrase [Novosphingobium sp. Gsoil 351]|uniref:tyrosine-type recombinase/integrase n=1 Tax=Novosphingobium sp. Gsoil 351 TaxID=2675225 RepID=UPI0012B4E3B1|nr:site-specific integrase [Novosphingobium sp. Gsoil 351]QGN53473.1 DUF4102 domain-containing protein [Novosphingobium sp. Gsoil 351]